MIWVLINCSEPSNKSILTIALILIKNLGLKHNGKVRNHIIKDKSIINSRKKIWTKLTSFISCI